MIKYKLQCENFHQFESWFASSSAFEKLKIEKLLSCEVCGSSSISKSLMSPSVNLTSEKNDIKPLQKPATKEETLIQELRKKVEKNCDYVGDNFAEEARAIHYGDSPKRSIYGKTSIQQAKSLYEDEIPITPLPWDDRKSN